MSAFSDRLKEELKRTKLTRTKLCELMDISRDTFYNWEYDLRSPNIVELQKLCELFECDAGYLLGEFSTRRAATIPLSETLHLTPLALDHLISAAKEGNPYISILSTILEYNENLLQYISMCITADYGHISTYVEIPDPFSPEGTHSILLSPKDIRTGDKMQLYNIICNFIDNERHKNGLSSYDEL